MFTRSLLVLALGLVSMPAFSEESSVSAQTLETRESDLAVTTATCPEGKQLIGGTYQAVGYSTTAQAPVYSRPAPGGQQAWQVAFTVGGQAYKAIAQCAVVKE